MTEKRQLYLDRAMATLHEAVEAGVNDIKTIQQESDFAPLRDRDDFKQLFPSRSRRTSPHSTS